MLMPLVTSQMPIPSPGNTAPTAAPAPTPVRSGAVPPDAQSQVSLKILEMINRHLLSAEPLPRQAMLRLFDILSKALTLTPAPQESLRDFGARIAAALESLPADRRASVEKTLIQRSITVPVRVLLTILKPPISDTLPRPLPTPNAPERTSLQPTPARASGRAAFPLDRRSVALETAVPVRAPLPQPAAVTAPLSDTRMNAIMAANGALQQALKKAFGPELTGAAVASVEAPEPEVAPSATSSKPEAAKSPAASRAADQTAVPHAGTDDIPLLRTSIAFLAQDTDALAQATALAQPALSDELRALLVDELGLAAPEPEIHVQTLPAEPAEQPSEWADQPVAPQEMSGTSEAPQNSLDTPAEEKPTALAAQPGETFDASVTTKATATAAPAVKTPDPLPVLIDDMLSDALSLLGETHAPALTETSAPLAKAFAQAAALDAQEALAAFHDTPEAEPDGLGTRIIEPATDSDFLHDIEMAQGNRIADAEGRHAALAPPAEHDSAARDVAPLLRLADSLFTLPVPFVTIPYLPAADVAFEEVDESEKEERGSADEEKEENHAGHEQSDARDEDPTSEPQDGEFSVAGPQADAMPQDAYRLMSGLD